MLFLGTLLLQELKPQAHELKLGIPPPQQLVTGRRIAVAPQVSSDLRDQPYRLSQQHRRF
jgi:hypothetical protein